MNYRHLHYFWVIAREGSIAKASQLLDLTPQTLSGQLATLENNLGGALFRRERRRLVLTELGKTVFQYANEMFTTAQALSDLLEQPPEGRPLTLEAGISASIHKLIAFQLLEPALDLEREVKFTCQTGAHSGLLAQLSRRELDLVLTDREPDAADASHFRTRQLADSAMSLFAAEPLARILTRDFPDSLNNQPFLASSVEAPYFTSLMNWFSANRIKVRVAAEVDDSALIKVFATKGLGYFAAPTSIRDEVCRQYQVVEVARIDEVRDTLYGVIRASGVPGPATESILAQGN